ncbi:phosphoribosyltransferase [Emticicia oligotrophica DSM 17448]|uniref:Phosphoribosyltransferase n=1 Tax=Emticicia oligotrophica (strain DSM 17448 / CIP 109782 / MTCC 6937 / GPTSA100-15) TaxID=929562 RepID=A0ABN4AIB9_EMTOG|nr:phosphoribosyltransferase family protein [Emticicia oligotrophica]AFK01831.1 phosphoribosyltransferase [Emticicia oligotrophica DSM 17448]
MSNQLLNKTQTLQKIRRIAYQIYEQNFEESSIIIAGINGEGYAFAEMLVNELKQISNIDTYIAKVSFEKHATEQPEITIESQVDTFRNKNIVLCDDVLNTGKTLAFSLRPFLSIPIKKLQVAVMVDRNHPNFPISADYVGYSLSTTLNEHIQVILSEEEKTGVYLF